MALFKRLAAMGGALVCACALGLIVSHPAYAVDVSSSIQSGDFATLKAAIENPERDTTVVVPGGEYVFSDPITVSKSLVLKNASGETVTFRRGKVQYVDNENRGLFEVESGSDITFDGDADAHLVLDGGADITFDHRADFERNGDKSDGVMVNHGTFLTLAENAQGTINHATFTNSAMGGFLCAPILIRSNAQLTMNGGVITHNYGLFRDLTENEKYEDGYNSHAAAAAIMNYDGTFVMNGGEITDNYNAFGIAAGAIFSIGKYPHAATVTINDGVISNNSVHDWGLGNGGGGAAGGGIYAGMKTNLTIKDGVFSHNFANGAGGFMFVDWFSNVVIDGGNFSNNETVYAGGAIATSDHFMQNDPGNFTNIVNMDPVENPYGITNVDQWYASGFGISLKINGGTFTQNKAYMGGALYIASDNSEINAGYFDGNEASRFGGAIYLASQPYKMKIRNSYFEGNKAISSANYSINLFPDLDPQYFPVAEGGAIWYCPTGTGDVNVSNGTAMFDNTAEAAGDDFTSMKKASSDYKVSVANRMLGGGYTGWLDDSAASRATSSSQELEPIKDSSEDLNLKARNTERSKETAKSLAKTTFVNNIARRGGAVGSNGHVDFGDANLTFDLTVDKSWNKAIAESAQKDVTVELYIVTKDAAGNETEHFSDSVELTKENGYKAQFTDLPLENYGRTVYRIKEVGDNYYATYATAIADGEAKATNTFDTADLINDDQVTVHVTNDPYVKAHFSFKSEDETKSLPEEVMNLLPADIEKLHPGITAQAPALSATSVPVANGTWTFKGWDADSRTVDTQDVSFMGTWAFTPNKDADPTYAAHFSFKSEDETLSLPDEVMKLLPTDVTDLLAGETVKATAISTTSVTVADGTWTFVGWDTDAKTIEDADVTFVGVWKFTPAKSGGEPEGDQGGQHTGNEPSKVPNTSDNLSVVGILGLLSLIAASGFGVCAYARANRRL